VLVVAGPTCSGKSALAMELAARFGGVVINADAMQCYRELLVLTARPSAADEARVPHALYGVRGVAEPVDAAWWRGAALGVMAATDRVPILCGGTGMYLNALLRGIAAVPEPGDAARAEARGLLAELGAAGLHARLAAADPVTAAGLRPSDGQRVARAWEVWRGTGVGLAEWQARPVPPPRVVACAVVLAPDRAVLRAAIARRWQDMLAAGAVAEVAALRALGLDKALPGMRAHGVPELGAYLDGAMTLEEAGRRACLAIGQYTKRQATWLRHHSVGEPAASFTINARYEASAQLSSEIMAGMTEFLSRRD
jgi:tRNA dimethylallyltransferase